MKRREKIFIGAVIFVVLAYGVWKGVSTMSRGDGGAVLPDGSRIALYDGSWGKPHRVLVQRGHSWLRPLRGFLPRALAARLFPWSQESNASSDVVFWFARTGHEPDKPVSLRMCIVDDTGCEAEVSQVSGTGSRVPGRNMTIIDVAPRTIPRRSRTMTLRLYSDLPRTSAGRPSTVHVGDVIVNNHLYGTYPQWTPRPLPQSVLAGGTTVTLKAFVTGIERPRPFLAGRDTDPLAGLRPADNGQAWTRVVFGIEERDGEIPERTVVKLKLSDATGNVLEPRTTYHGRGTAEICAEFEGMLWRSERAWKLTAEFARMKDFEPDELWKVEKIPAPRKGLLIPLNLSTEIQGAPLSLQAVAGSTYTGNDWNYFSHSGLTLKIAMASQGVSLGIATATDDSGRMLLPGGRCQADATYFLELQPPADGGAPFGFNGRTFEDARVKFVNVTFSLQKNLKAEFRVDPNDPAMTPKP